MIMLWGLLVAFFSVGSLATYCAASTYSTACDAPAVSNCLAVCTFYKNQDSCLASMGCVWNASRGDKCNPANPTLQCATYANQTACATNNMCSWQTTPCKFNPSRCQAINNSASGCDSLSVANCTSQAGCSVRGSCDASDRCGMIADQNGCTGSAGCFWMVTQLTYTSSIGNFSDSLTECNLCFNDPSNTGSPYQTARARVGQTCNYTSSFFDIEYNVLSVVAAGSGCSGGSPVPDIYTCTNYPIDSGAVGLSSFSSFSSSSSSVALLLLLGLAQSLW